MEARKLLENGGARTAVDTSFVNAVSTKWGPMLEGIQNPYQRGVMGILFENQMDHLRGLNEETLSTGVGSFTKYIFPILRRVFPNLIANQIVSVQPMTAPVGGIFTYEYKYGNTKGNITANQNLIQTFSEWYSSEFIDFETKVLTPLANTQWDNAVNPTDRTPFSWLPVAPRDDTKGQLTTFSYLDATATTVTITDNGAGILAVATAPSFPADVGTAVGTINYVTGAWTLNVGGLLAGNLPAGGANAITATYFYNSELVANTTAPGAGVDSTTFNMTLGQQAAIPEVNIDITLTTVTAITRKLKARWSAEAVDDLRAFHGLNAETELVAGISNEIALELDREIIDDLITGARWSFTYDVSAAQPLGWVANTQNDSLSAIRDLLTAISSMSSKIHSGSMRAPANFLVVPPEIGALFAQLTTHGDFMNINQIETQPVSPSYGPMNSNFGVQRLGTLLNKFAVYQDPFMDSQGVGGVATTKRILVGLKGSSFLDAGYVYAPYIPLQVTPTFLDPDDFTFRKGLRTRYAKQMLRAEYYGTILVQGLPAILG